MTRASSFRDHASAAGFSLIELIVAMGLFTLIMGVTMSGLSNVIKGNEMVVSLATVNAGLRTGMDLMVRDLLQVGSGLPSSHTVSIPNGTGSAQVRIPGPPGTTFLTDVGDLVLPAVIPKAGAGPTIDGVSTDTVSMLMADNAFLDVGLTAVSNTTVTVAAGPDLGNGPDRVLPGQLMLISKGSFNTLVEVTAVNVNTRVLTFADGDSLRLNQVNAANGTLKALNAQAPVNSAASTRISRMRMISYYLDNITDPAHPRLVRRINNGNATTFNNTLGTAVVIDAVDLQFTYDISNGVGNPGGVEMNATDLGTGGACSPSACAETQIRKVTVMLRSKSPSRATEYVSPVLRSQVALRAMAFVDRYR